MIEVRNLAFAYGSRKILRDVSFVVSPGEIATIVGANGAGKTTLMRVLSTLMTPDSGSVLVDGADALARPLKYRRQMGYMSERVALDDDMTVRDYLQYRAELKGETGRRMRRRLGESAALCRISDILREPIGTLSAGLKKRVALADALLLRPRVLILDDFLAGLDRTMRETSGAILTSAASFASVIVTGHELHDLAKWTTRFLVLSNGIISHTLETAGQDMASLDMRLAQALEVETT